MKGIMRGPLIIAAVLIVARVATEQLGMPDSINNLISVATFYVLIAPIYAPAHLARSLTTIDRISGGRLIPGFGVGWSPEESLWCGAPFSDRGARGDEAIEVLKLILGGGMVEYHGKHFEFGKLQMSPAPSEPVPIYVGGHTGVALRRAARVGDGWSSAMMRFDDLRTVIGKLAALRAEYGRADKPFEIQAVCVDRFGLDGFRQLADIGVTDAIVVPWRAYGVGFDGPLAAKKDGLRRFAEEVISKL